MKSQSKFFYKFATYTLTPILLLSCNTTNTCMLEENIITIEFKEPLNFDNKTITIDNTQFRHSIHKDSINSGNYLPSNEIIIHQIESKQAKKKTNTITLGTTLANKLKKTNNYIILNYPQVITQGIISFKRKDNKPIKISMSKKYPATVNKATCK